MNCNISSYVFPGIGNIKVSPFSISEKLNNFAKYMVNNFSVYEDFLINKSRNVEDYVIPRGVYYYCMVKKERISPTQIMKSHIGIHDRTTILHSLKTIQRYIDTNDILLTKYKDIL